MKFPVLIFVAASVLTSCEQNNTVYGSGFRPQTFGAITNGMTAAQLTSLLGEPLNLYTHVTFPKLQAADNYAGKIQPGKIKDSEIAHYVWVYSLPRNKHRDYVVYEVSVDTNNFVVGKQTYTTD